MRRPSENLPVEEVLKYFSPFGGPRKKPSPATCPPVSEFESPKLKTEG